MNSFDNTTESFYIYIVLLLNVMNKLFTIQTREYLRRKIAVLSIWAIVIASIGVALLARTQTVKAATLTEASIRLSRMGASSTASASYPILVVAKPATAGTETTVKLTFPTSSAFTVSGTPTVITVSTTSLPSTYQGESLVSWPGVGTSAAAVSGGDVTVNSTDLTVGTLYGFYITGGITNPATGNAGAHSITMTTQITGPATLDSTVVAVDVTTTNADQVTVTATVGSSFNFALNSNSLSLGALTTGGINTGNVTVDIDSNAENGWIAWMRSEGAAATLASASTGDSIASTGTVNGAVETALAGTENYIVDVAGAQGGSSNGSLTIGAEYDGNGTTTGGTLDTTYQQIAQSTGQALNDTLTLTAIAAISTLTQAATDYTDTWEVIGAGNF